MAEQTRGADIPVDVVEHDDRFELFVDLPGYTTRDITLRARGDRLQIVAEGNGERAGRMVHQERPTGRVSRVVELPERIDEKHVSAKYTNGLLWIRAKKWERRSRPVGPRGGTG